MSQMPSSARMRLVGHRDPEVRHAWTTSQARRDVKDENVAAAGMDTPSLDPRWHLASRAYAELKQGPLTPVRREGLIDEADRLGLRPFDASLIIAIAQDHARTGRPIEEAEPTLMLVKPAQQRSGSGFAQWGFAAACAMALSGLILMWMAN